MAAQALESARWFAELAAIHLPGMRPEYKRTLLLLARCKTRDAIAAREGVEPATVKRWVETATAEIASHLSAERANPGELRGAWVVCHLACCLAVELEAA